MSDNNYIRYYYDAAGIKLRQEVYYNGNFDKETDYIGNFVYEYGELAYILTDEGRLVPKENNSGFDYEYFIKDHLGNVRLVVADKNNDEDMEVLQETHYYPFGMTMEGMSYWDDWQLSVNRIKYNGKELEDYEFSNGSSLGWYDYGARHLDPVLGRWHRIDPLAEKYTDQSPYNYVYNNPINLIDQFGMQGTDWYRTFNPDGTGEMRYFSGMDIGYFLLDNNLWYNVGDGKTTFPMGQTYEGYGFIGYNNGDYALSLPEATVTGKRPRHDGSAAYAFCDGFAQVLNDGAFMAATGGLGGEIFAGTEGLALLQKTLLNGTINSGYDIANDLWNNGGRWGNVDKANLAFNYIPYGYFGKNTGRLIGAIASPILKSTIDYKEGTGGWSTSFGLGNQKPGNITFVELVMRTGGSALNYKFQPSNISPMGAVYNISDRYLRSSFMSHIK